MSQQRKQRAKKTLSLDLHTHTDADATTHHTHTVKHTLICKHSAANIMYAHTHSYTYWSSCPYSPRLIWWQLPLIIITQMATGELNSPSIDSVCVARPCCNDWSITKPTGGSGWARFILYEGERERERKGCKSETRRRLRMLMHLNAPA